MNKKNYPVRLMDMIAPWFEQAFTLHAFGEQVTWDINWVVAQVPPGPGQPPRLVPLVQLYSHIRGSQLGSNHVDLAQMELVGFDEEEADNQVRDAMGRMLKARSETLAQALAEGNGAPPPGARSPGGIVLP
jgi:hypothetical protein